MDVTEEKQKEYARRVKLSVTIGGHDATDTLMPSLLSATYTDNASGKADEVSLELHDRDGKWLGEWAPQKGTEVSMCIECSDWFGAGEAASLNCGAFKVDEIEYSGPPTKVTIKAVSASLSDGLRETKKTQAWEGYSLQSVAGEIAQRNGLELLYNADAHPFQRQDQREESDLPFLQRLASSRGVNVKVHDGKIICEAAIRGDARAAAVNIARTGEQFSPTSWSFKEKSEGTAFTGCDVQYLDPDTGEMVTHSFGAPGKDGQRKKVTLINQKVESRAEAEAFAKGGLRDKNKDETTGTLDIMGHPGVVAGCTLSLTGFGKFDGKYFVEKATHKIQGKYTTGLELRNTLDY